MANSLFCTNCGSPVSEQAVVCMSCGARPTGHRKFCRHCGVAINPEQVICIKCGVPIAGKTIIDMGNSVVGLLSPADQVRGLKRHFMAFCLCTVMGFLLWVIGFLAAFSGFPEGFITSFLILGCLLLFIGGIFHLVLLYQIWKTVDHNIARTTPGKAVGFLFIPIFNLYWMFVAYKGLGDDLNKSLQQQGIQYEVDKNSGLVFCVLCCVCNAMQLFAPPIVIMLAGGVTGIFLTLFLHSAKNGAIASLRQKGNDEP